MTIPQSIRRLTYRISTALTVNLLSRSLWLVALAIWWSWADLWAMAQCVSTMETPEQINGFVELGKQHRMLTGTIVLGWLARNAVIRKIESTET